VAMMLVASALQAQTSSEAPRREDSPPIDRQPYKIQVHVAIDPATRIDPRRRADVLSAWTALVRRFVGGPWVVAVAEEGSPLSHPGMTVDSLEPEAMAGLDSGFDKIWAI